MQLSDEVTEGQLLWEPDARRRDRTHLVAYLRRLERERGLRFAGYDALWRWSVADLAAFSGRTHSMKEGDRTGDI